MSRHYLFGEPTDELDLEQLFNSAREKAARLARVSARRRIQVLSRTGRAWSDPDYAPRRVAQQQLPELLGLSPEMVSRSLDMLAGALSEEALECKVAAELGSMELMDGWGPRAGTDFFWRARPFGVVLAVASGNVFVGSAVTLAESLLAGNATILKAPSGDPLFARLFGQSLMDHDHQGGVAEATAVVAWKGGDRSLESAFKQNCDAIVITGGENAVRRYREEVPSGVEVIDYGPKLSLAAIAGDAPGWENPAEMARRLARDVSLWDQMACSAPQLLYLEGQDRVESFLPLLAEAMQELSLELPPGKPGFQTRVEITKERQLALFDQALDLSRMWSHPGFTLLYEKHGQLRPSPLSRTLLVRTIEDLEHLAPDLERLGPYLQSVGLAAGPARSCQLGRLFTDCGATRVVPLGEMAGGSAGEPHDGRLGLEALIRWVTLKAPEVTDPWEAVPREVAFRRQQEEASALAEWARRHSPFYQRHYGQEKQWEKLPTLGREEVREQTPPYGYDLLTAPLDRATVLRSGGTSGEPRYSIFSPQDYQADMEAGARLLKGCGLEPGDRCANLFLSGDLYGSFLSIHRILDLCSVVNFPFTSSAPLESVVTTMERFDINVVMGVSSQLVRFFARLLELKRKPPLRKIIYGGEPFPQADQQRIREQFGIDHIRSIIGANDGGPIGFQCSACKGPQHHLTSQHILLEILEPASLEAVPPGEVGEMVITCLHRRLMPLIRYRVGDLARMLAEPCACGRTSPRFELIGRADDTLCIASTNTAWSDVSRALEGLAGLSGSMQLVGEGETIRVRIEQVEAGTSPDRVRARLLQRIPVLEKRLEEGLLEALEIELCPPGSLERNPRSGKLVRVVDRRMAIGR